MRVECRHVFRRRNKLHCAAKAGVWGRRADFEAANVAGTEQVLEACRRAGVGRLVHTSSPSVCFDGTDHVNAGNDLPFAPERTANVVAQYELPLPEEHSAFARIEYFHTGEFYYDASNLASERYDLLNVRLGGGGENWRLEGWIENVTDEDYIPLAFQINPADPTAFVGESAAPRTYGVTMRFTF